MRCIALFFVLFLAACPARQATPVQISQPGDGDMTCDQLAEQITRNRAQAGRLVGAEEDTVAGNVAVGVVGTLILWPAWMALDLSNAEQIQFRALQDRNRNLARLQETKGC